MHIVRYVFRKGSHFPEAVRHFADGAHLVPHIVLLSCLAPAGRSLRRAAFLRKPGRQSLQFYSRLLDIFVFTVRSSKYSDCRKLSYPPALSRIGSRGDPRWFRALWMRRRAGRS
jgi:hypothetical protein